MFIILIRTRKKIKFRILRILKFRENSRNKPNYNPGQNISNKWSNPVKVDKKVWYVFLHVF